MAGESTFTTEPAHSDPVPKETDVDRIAWRVIAGGLLLGMLALYVLALWFDWLPWLRGWMNYPVGWTWALNRQPPLSSFIPIVCIIAGIWATATLAELSRHTPYVAGMGAGNRTVKVAYFVVLILLGYGLQLSLLGLKSDNPNGLLVERVTNRVFTGYFNHATTVPNLETLLSGYPQVFQTRICPHCHDHPPGPSLFYWLNIQTVATLPDDWENTIASYAWQLVGESPELAEVRQNISSSHFLGGFLGGTLILVLAAMVVLPAYGLARRLGPRGYEFRLAALSLAIPGLMLMASQFDQVLALISATALYLGLRGLASTNTLGVALWAGSAGVVIAFGLILSWAVGVMVAILLALWLVCVVASRRALFLRESARPRMTKGEAVAWVVGLGAGVLLPLSLAPARLCSDRQQPARRR